MDLQRKRGGVKGEITKLGTRIANHENGTKLLDADDVSLLVKNLQSLDTKLQEINLLIYAACSTDEEVDKAVDEGHEVQTRFMEVSKRLLKLQQTFSIPTTATTCSSNSVKLPRIDPPKFSGRYEDWQSFQDLFIATVENNKMLSGAQKLQYLKTCVTGDAASIIKSFPVTDIHYRKAWGLLADRYDNKREITNSLIRRMFKQQRILSESAVHLRQLMDVTAECVRSLDVLGRPVDKWDDLIVYILVDKLDPETRGEWAMSLIGSEPASYKDLQDFLEQHIRRLQAKGSKPHNHTGGDRRQTSSHHAGTDSSCLLCNKLHPVYQCNVFKALSPEERSSKIRAASYCCNCLKPGHKAKDCESSWTCRTCKKPHHSMLHFETKKQSTNKQVHTTVTSHSEEESDNGQEDTSSFHSDVLSYACQTTPSLLKTALVNLEDSTGQLRICRAFLDDGSQSSFITEDCAKSLGLKKSRVNVQISGLSSSSLGNAKSEVVVHLSSIVHQATMELEALVVPQITAPMPRIPCDATNWTHIEGLTLADPSFNIPSKIDLLLGTDEIAGLLIPGIVRGPKNTPTAQNTLLGWVLMGRTSAKKKMAHVQVNHIEVTLDKILEKFWTLEELPPKRFFTAEELRSEQHFIKNYSRDATGRYTVKLPFTPLIANLGSSREQALRRFLSLERRFKSVPKYKEEYLKFMREYEALGHMQLIPAGQVDSKPHYYLPHHFVLKESSSTTKFRVVFDGSAKTTSGVSLNKTLMVGPTIQDDIFSLLLRFRLNKVAIKGDITKMYRQFRVSDSDADFQRILWRESPDQPIKDYKLVTITYGTASAPFQATRCLQQLAKDEQEKYPAAAKALLNDVYVDDLMTGAKNSAEGKELVNQVTQLVSSGAMEIRKWMTNDPIVFNSIPPELREAKDELDLDDSLQVMALGVKWKPSSDCFIFSVRKHEADGKLTKRKSLSELAMVFDPYGFLQPVTINAKMTFQELWLLDVNWDDILSRDIQSRWKSYQDELPALEKLEIPRCITVENAISHEIHGFSDASNKAYSAVAYLVSTHPDGTRSSKLIAAKTRVAPVKIVSIPRLELCGAVLLTDLLCAIIKACKFSCSVTAYTDSELVLKWLAAFPGRWKTFVANRVAYIQEAFPFEQWRHVRSEDNPADCASRGISAEELLHHSLWWHGPQWLLHPNCPNTPHTPGSLEVAGAELEERTKSTVVMLNDVNESIINRFSSLRDLLHVAAYMLRFRPRRLVQDKPKTLSLTTSELKSALNTLIRQVQANEFHHEISNLVSKKPLLKSKILQLNPFMDSEGFLRVGGRINNAQLSENRKHPIILPCQNHLTILIIRDCHIKHFHSGFQLTHSVLSRSYWIVRGRDTIRHFIRKCVICRRQNASKMQQLMGNLPTPRVIPTPPFQSCGVDYAGPYNLLKSKGRGAKTYKAYFAVFVCFTTKAIHLEATTDLSSEAFIACFKRFSSRRGTPTNIFSDCGTNFVGADKELRKLTMSSKFNQDVNHSLVDNGTTWHFNPPAAPHQGGLWEAGVKSVKYHLRRVVGEQHMTLDEFMTLLCSIEAILNSRPLCPMSPDPNDYDALTPGHFLIGRPLNSIPEEDLTPIKENRLSRWQRVQQMTQHFWKRWSAEYLTTLQQRFKWRKKHANIQVNDLVLIHEEMLPPAKWKLARVISTHPGKDGLVRVVTVKTATGEYERPIAKLSPVMSCNDEDSINK